MKNTLLSLWGVIKMINVLTSDFYKLFQRKSFYICGIISAIFGIISVFLVKSTAPVIPDGMDASLLGYSGIGQISSGLIEVTLFAIIFLSMFVSSEFSFGTIKNIASRGVSRVQIYLSKLIVSIFVVVVYSLFSALSGFITGSILYGAVGEFSGQVWLDIFRMIGLFLLAQISIQSIFIMISFIIRHTGGAVAVNIGVYMLVGGMLLPVMDFALNKWFDLGFKLMEYWPYDYIEKFSSMNIANNVINTGIIVCVSYLILSTAIGIFDFCRRDIK